MTIRKINKSYFVPTNNANKCDINFCTQATTWYQKILLILLREQFICYHNFYFTLRDILLAIQNFAQSCPNSRVIHLLFVRYLLLIIARLCGMFLFWEHRRE